MAQTRTVGKTHGQESSIGAAITWATTNHDFDTDGILTIQLVDDGDVFNEAVNITGIPGTPSATAYLILETAPGLRHSGFWDGNRAQINMTLQGDEAIHINMDWVHIRYMQIRLRYGLTSLEAIRNQGDNNLIEKCVVRLDSVAADQDAIHNNDYEVVNLCLFDNVIQCYHESHAPRSGFNSQNNTAFDQETNIEHCTVYNGGNIGHGIGGKNTSSGITTINAYNNLVKAKGDGTYDAYATVGTGDPTWTGKGNVAADSSATTEFGSGNGNVDNESWSDNGTGDTDMYDVSTVASWDFRLKETGTLNSALKNAETGSIFQIGTDPNAARVDTTLDIAGNPRPEIWSDRDCGAFQLTTSTTVTKPSIFIPRKITRTSKPNRDVGIDWSNPLCKNLQNAYNVTASPIIRDSARNMGDFDTQPEFTIKTEQIGKYLANDGTSAKKLTGPTNSIHESSLITVVVVARANSVLTFASNATMLLSKRYHANTAVAAKWGIGIGSSTTDDAKVAFHANMTLPNQTAHGLMCGTTVLTLGEWYVMAFTLNDVDNDIKLYLNGVEENGGAHTGSFPSSGSYPIYSGHWSGATGITNRDNDLALACYWDRVLSPVEIAAISKNPWQVFEPISAPIQIADTQQRSSIFIPRGQKNKIFRPENARVMPQHPMAKNLTVYYMGGAGIGNWLKQPGQVSTNGGTVPVQATKYGRGAVGDGTSNIALDISADDTLARHDQLDGATWASLIYRTADVTSHGDYKRWWSRSANSGGGDPYMNWGFDLAAPGNAVFRCFITNSANADQRIDLTMDNDISKGHYYLCVGRNRKSDNFYVFDIYSTRENKWYQGTDFATPGNNTTGDTNIYVNGFNSTGYQDNGSAVIWGGFWQKYLSDAEVKRLWSDPYSFIETGRPAPIQISDTQQRSSTTIPRKIVRTKVPEGSAAIDWANPLSRGLDFAVFVNPKNPKELVHGGMATSWDGSKVKAASHGTREGYAYVTNNEAPATNALRFPWPKRQYNAMTFVLLGGLTARPANYAAFVGEDYDTNFLLQMQTVAADDFRWVIHGPGWNQSKGLFSGTAWSPLARNWSRSIAGRWDKDQDSGGSWGYVDGQLAITGNTSTTICDRTQDSALNYLIVGGDSSFNQTSQIFGLLIWDRRLSEEELRAIDANPYQILEPISAPINIGYDIPDTSEILNAQQPSIFIPRKTTRTLKYPQINYSNPITRGLIFCAPITSQHPPVDLISGVIPTSSNGAPAPSACRDGFGLLGNNSGRWVYGDLKAFDNLSAFTQMARFYTPPGGGTTDGYFFGKVDSSWRFHMLISSSSQNLNSEIVAGQRDEESLYGGVGGLDHLDGVYANVYGVWDGTTHKTHCVHPGGHDTSAGGGLTGTISGDSDPFALVDRGDQSRPLDGVLLSFVAFWNRALTEYELRSLHHNPYQLLQSTSAPIQISDTQQRSSIFIPRKIVRTSKPKDRPGINWNHPLSKGLIHAVYVGAGDGAILHDLAQGSRHTNNSPSLTYAGNMAGSQPARHGWGAHCDGGSDDGCSLNDVAVTDQFSAYVMASRDASTSNEHLFSRHPGWFISHSNVGSDPVRLAIINESANEVSVDCEATQYPTNTIKGFGGVYNGATIRTFGNGVFHASASQTGNIDLTGFTRFGRYHGSTAFTYDGEIYLALAWSRALSDGEMKQVHDNPYQILEPISAPINIGYEIDLESLSEEELLYYLRNKNRFNIKLRM